MKLKKKYMIQQLSALFHNYGDVFNAKSTPVIAS